MTWMEEAMAYHKEAWREMVSEAVDRAVNKANGHKGRKTMQVSYNGFTGELVKLEKKAVPYEFTPYDLSIFDSEKLAVISFTGVKLEDVTFLGGEVSFRECE